MLTTVKFDRQLSLHRDKIDDVLPNGVLPSEFNTTQFFPAQNQPQPSFSRRR
jgi:hypothetical protein